MINIITYSYENKKLLPIKPAINVKYQAIKSSSLINNTTHGKATTRGGADNINIADDNSSKLVNVSDQIEIFEEVQFTKSDMIAREYNTISKIKKSYKCIMFGEDSLLDVRKKIQLITGIPFYRQHVFIMHEDRAIQLSYRIIGGPYRIDIVNEVNSHTGDYIDNIPILSALTDITIESYEEFRILSDVLLISCSIHVVDIELFINKAQVESYIADIYTKEMIYQSFVVRYWPIMTMDIFVEYINNESDMMTKYPLLSFNNSELVNFYEKQDELISSIHNAPINKETLLIGITKATIFQSGINEILLRNLFDSYELSIDVPYIKCKCEIDGTRVSMLKTYKNAYVYREYMPEDSVLINMRITHNDLTMPASFVISLNGSYYVETSWRDDFYIDFVTLSQIVEKSVNPIIEYINSMGNIIVKHSITKIRQSMIKLTDISMALYWKHSISSESFNDILRVLAKYAGARIITPRSSAHSNEYIFMKGMHKFDHRIIESLINGIDNYYDRFIDANTAQKWEDLFLKNRILKIHHRYTDVKFEIFNIREEEKDVVYNYISAILSMITVTESTTVKSNINKKLKKLKETDPELFMFDIGGSTEVLSKKCQKPLQPIIYTPEEFKERLKNASPTDKTHMLEYWNFTTNEPAYYECTNPKFPYVRFITGVHPKGYCIPCCKKVQIIDDGRGVGEQKLKIHKQCLERRTADVADNNMIKSRYVASYGKDLKAGRLSLLPSETLNNLINSNAQTVDECASEFGYYLLGVDSYVIKILPAISIILNEPVESILNKIISYLKSNKIIALSMFGVDENNITEQFLLSHFTDSNSSTNELLQIISNIYEYRFLLFTARGETVELNIDSGITNVFDILMDNIGLILARYDEDVVYMPIIYTNHNTFYKQDIITKRSFSPDDSVIDIILAMIKSYVVPSAHITTLYALESSMRTKKYKIIHKFANTNNHCYCVLMSTVGKKEQLFHIAIDNSFTNTDVLYEPFLRQNFNTIGSVALEFLSSRDSLFAVESWLMLAGKCIGFVYLKMNFYNAITDADIKKYGHSIKRTHLLYDPDILNMRMTSVAGKITRNDEAQMHEAMYRRYLYQLILVEFGNYFNKSRDTTHRDKIIKIAQKLKPEDKTSIKKIEEAFPEEDLDHIRNIISEFMYDHKSSETLIRVIYESTFSFDSEVLNSLKQLPHEKLVKKLVEISRDIITIGKEEHITFGNIFVSCEEGSSNSYCRKKKLVVSKSDFDKYIDILASDILNPLKSKILFSKFYLKNIMDPYQFIRRPYEQITVDFN